MMGAGISPYCLDIDGLRSLHGCGDLSIVERIEAMDLLDDDWAELDEDYPDAPTTRDATVSILNGQYPENAARYAGIYRRALQLMCCVTSEPLPNADEFEKFYDFKIVDTILEKMGVAEPCRMTALVHKAGLMPIPGDGDTHQDVGYLTADDVSTAWSVLKTPNLMGVDATNARRVLMFRSWVEKAASVKNGVVGFYG